MQKIQITCEDLLKKVEALKHAKDENGIRLYDDEDIAGFFGQRSYADLEKVVKDARGKYRKSMITRIAKLREDGYSSYDIAMKLGMTIKTVDILLDKEGNDRIDRVKEYDKKVREQLNKSFDEFNSFSL